MKEAFAAMALTLAPGACGISYPQSGAEMQSMASTSALVSSDSYTVSRSAGAVTNSLRDLSSRCLNRTTQSVLGVRQTQFGATGTQFVTKWETSVRTTGNGSELAMRMIPIRGGINEPPEGYIFFAVSVQSNGSDAQVTNYYGFGTAWFSELVKDWVNGNTRNCPELPR